MDDFLILKTVHILSATLLFGAGIGSAFHLYAAHLRGNIAGISVAARNVVLADWMFTTPSLIVQPASGIGLALMGGYDLLSSWLIVSYTLYGLAGACWVYVVGLQLHIARLSQAAALSGGALPAAYYRAIRRWFWSGWPAFFAFCVIFFLMVAKPALW